MGQLLRTTRFVAMFIEANCLTGDWSNTVFYREELAMLCCSILQCKLRQACQSHSLRPDEHQTTDSIARHTPSAS